MFVSCERYLSFAPSDTCPTFFHPVLFTQKADFYTFYSFGSFDFCLVSSQWGAPAGDLKDEARGQDTIPLLCFCFFSENSCILQPLMQRKQSLQDVLFLILSTAPSTLF